MTHFILTEAHLALLRAMNWQRQRDFHGAPGVDDKREVERRAGSGGA